MKAAIIKLECITNMHVGNGEVNYNIIDNEVERDPVTGYPTINASGVKGALREFFTRQGVNRQTVDELFGADTQGKSTQGKLKILGADMLAIPLRASLGKEPYYLVTTKTALDQYEEKCRLFLKKNITFKMEKPEENCAVEGFPLEKQINGFGGFEEKKVYLMGRNFKEASGVHEVSLPVIARNHLDQGKSTNLWYEEVVPHKSLFTFAVIADESPVLERFTETVENQVIQFGGNASIGYGLCKATVIGE